MNPSENWFTSPLGEYLLKVEKSIYDRHVTDIFGFNAIQIGMLETNLLEQSRMPKVLYADIRQGDVQCEPEYLPFDASTFDLVCLPHALEFCDNPHQSLREAERILVPEGYLLITGFNPISAWGVRKWLSKRKSYPWSGKSFSHHRIKDWLALLNLEVIDISTHAYILPINDQRWIQRQSRMETLGLHCCTPLGGIYFIVAKKRVANMIPLKMKWKSQLLQPGLISTQPKKKPHTKVNK